MSKGSVDAVSVFKGTRWTERQVEKSKSEIYYNKRWNQKSQIRKIQARKRRVMELRSNNNKKRKQVKKFKKKKKKKLKKNQKSTGNFKHSKQENSQVDLTHRRVRKKTGGAVKDRKWKVTHKTWGYKLQNKTGNDHTMTEPSWASCLALCRHC